MQTHRYAKDVQEKKEQYEHYNILPLHAIGVKPAIMELPEVIIDTLCPYCPFIYKYAVRDFWLPSILYSMFRDYLFRSKQHFELFVM